MGSKLLVADKRGRIFSHPELEAAGMEAGAFFRLEPPDLIKLPAGSRLFMLPDRSPVGCDGKSASFVTLNGLYAAAAFISPGHTITHNTAYKELGRPARLPLFSYGAAAMYKGELYAAAVMIDKDRRHDSQFIDMKLVKRNIKKFRKIFPRNRLVRHLEQCALFYGCPGSQNFFLSRYEGVLPTSPSCNASCIGCISYRPDKHCSGTQPRIKFIPTPEEVSEIALFHINNVRNTVVSFGQGCEGEPLLCAETIEKAIRLIRAKTSNGIINMNTNASLPDKMAGLFDAGLNSIRVSMNSARKEYYMRYYKPKGYFFRDVLRSIKIAKSKGVFVSINYLTMPGFTDTEEEFAALKKLVSDYRIDMIQWRNLNFDPLSYFRMLQIRPGGRGVVGIKNIICSLRNEYPALMMGYFNPRVIASRRRLYRG